ncbi:dihydrolipoyl dehydrogenase [Stenotrophobium rhamnosiphilum]|uniref:Dihydrolipoyl dehydrogenase n=1 Tax=Stenotrophobium rhamnosiphilum TaxID=2029166 RepID=A0A2T5ME50_9GAMM|nr:dihydrolipoyl dehydrogenase [Stenotrophobium rhamnosiphilum]PTU30860.1 dihydrolipoyl dehydrogenase [Stenotrophobium rhamnosiphilum]
MNETIKTKVLVVGGGPGGYVAAIRAGQLGLDTVLVEADRLGGTCLIRGCIPSKALIHVASKFEELSRHASDDALGIRLSEAPVLNLAESQRWKSGVVDKLNVGVGSLLRKAKVRTLQGWATFLDAKTCSVKTANGDITVQAEHVILANGSVPVELPNLPFGGAVMSSTEVLSLQELPKQLVVVGAGYIGLELGIAFARLGSRVTFVEAGPRILPLYDTQMTKPVEQWLKKHGIAVHLNARAKGLSESSVLTVENGSGPLDIPYDKILVTVGRAPSTNGWGLENMAVDMNGRWVKIDDQCRTSMRNVWAIGDLVGEPMLAHKASAQGEMVAEIIAGHRRSFDPVAIAAVCFTEPEIVGAGLSPDEAKAAGIEIKVATFPFAANGRSLTMEAGVDGGFVRVTARADNHLVLGLHAVGAHASELSGEFALALEMGARIEDLAGTIHVHPTMSEALPEAALATLGRAIHA